MLAAVRFFVFAASEASVSQVRSAAPQGAQATASQGA
jgi:hypothetical protein